MHLFSQGFRCENPCGSVTWIHCVPSWQWAIGCVSGSVIQLAGTSAVSGSASGTGHHLRLLHGGERTNGSWTLIGYGARNSCASRLCSLWHSGPFLHSHSNGPSVGKGVRSHGTSYETCLWTTLRAHDGRKASCRPVHAQHPVRLVGLQTRRRQSQADFEPPKRCAGAHSSQRPPPTHVWCHCCPTHQRTPCSLWGRCLCSVPSAENPGTFLRCVVALQMPFVGRRGGKS